VTGLSIVLDGLTQRKLLSFDPFHQVPRALVGFSNFLDLCIKELAFRSSSSFAEGAPVLGCFIICYDRDNRLRSKTLSIVREVGSGLYLSKQNASDEVLSVLE